MIAYKIEKIIWLNNIVYEKKYVIRDKSFDLL